MNVTVMVIAAVTSGVIPGNAFASEDLSILAELALVRTILDFAKARPIH